MLLTTLLTLTWEEILNITHDLQHISNVTMVNVEMSDCQIITSSHYQISKVLTPPWSLVLNSILRLEVSDLTSGQRRESHWYILYILPVYVVREREKFYSSLGQVQNNLPVRVSGSQASLLFVVHWCKNNNWISFSVIYQPSWKQLFFGKHWWLTQQLYFIPKSMLFLEEPQEASPVAVHGIFWESCD